MPLSSIDKTLVCQRFNRGVSTYGEHAVVQQRMATELVEALTRTTGHGAFGRVLEPGCGDGTLTSILLSQLTMQTLTVNDIADAFRQPLSELAARHPDVAVNVLPGDVEQITLPTPIDLLIANAVMQWLNDLATFYQRAAEALAPEGILAISTFGEDNLPELCELTGQSLGYLSYAAHRDLLATHFDILEGWERRETLTFADGREVLRHLKATGVNALTPQHWTRGDLHRFKDQYQERFGTPAGVPLTFHPVTFIAKVRHARTG